jgi:tetratricopeptide (TPR) repeat protein
MNRKALGRCFLLIIFFAAVGNSTWAEAVSREAEKYMNRGMAAVEMANSPDDYKSAIKEFEQAVRLAPRWPAPYFNLGYLHNKVGKYQEALNSYRKYLVLVPNAPDAVQVQKEIDQIEYRLEKVSEAAKIRSWLEGEWVINAGLPGQKPWPVTFIVNGDSVYANLPTTVNLGEGGRQRFIDHETISVKQEGRKIQFSVVFKEVIRERGYLELIAKINAQYNLNLIAPDRMEGTRVFNKKHYNSDGSIWKAKNGTEKEHASKSPYRYW